MTTNDSLCFRWADRLLRFSLFGYALGVALSVYLTKQTHIGNLLFLHVFDDWFPVDDPYVTAVVAEHITASLFLLLAGSILLKPRFFPLLICAAYALTDAVAGALMGGYRFSDWTPGATALRWGTPLALLLLVAGPRWHFLQPWRAPAAATLLRILIATVFFVHGYQALRADPVFLDLIIGSSNNLLGIRPEESTAQTILLVIAFVDFVVVAAVLLLPWVACLPGFIRAKSCPPAPRWALFLACGFLLWASFWGLITALSRMTALGHPEGWQVYTEVLLRTPHALAPLALLLLCPRSRTVRSSEAAPSEL